MCVSPWSLWGESETINQLLAGRRGQGGERGQEKREHVPEDTTKLLRTMFLFFGGPSRARAMNRAKTADFHRLASPRVAADDSAIRPNI